MDVDLAPLKTLFPQSITFDCSCTKGKAVNRASFVGWGGGVGAKGGQSLQRLHYKV